VPDAEKWESPLPPRNSLAVAFDGPPGAYDDNDGSYRVRIGINEIPTKVPEPASLALLGIGLAAVKRARRKTR